MNVVRIKDKTYASESTSESSDGEEDLEDLIGLNGRTDYNPPTKTNEKNKDEDDEKDEEEEQNTQLQRQVVHHGNGLSPRRRSSTARQREESQSPLRLRKIPKVLHTNISQHVPQETSQARGESDSQDVLLDDDDDDDLPDLVESSSSEEEDDEDDEDDDTSMMNTSSVSNASAASGHDLFVRGLSTGSSLNMSFDYRDNDDADEGYSGDDDDLQSENDNDEDFAQSAMRSHHFAQSDNFAGRRAAKKRNKKKVLAVVDVRSPFTFTLSSSSEKEETKSDHEEPILLNAAARRQRQKEQRDPKKYGLALGENVLAWRPTQEEIDAQKKEPWSGRYRPSNTMWNLCVLHGPVFALKLAKTPADKKYFRDIMRASLSAPSQELSSALCDLALVEAKSEEGVGGKCTGGPGKWDKTWRKGVRNGKLSYVVIIFYTTFLQNIHVCY